MAPNEDGGQQEVETDSVESVDMLSLYTVDLCNGVVPSNKGPDSDPEEEPIGHEVR